jgi:hypothetical protein
MMTAKKPIWTRPVMRLVSRYGRGVNEKFHPRLPEGRTTVPISTPRLLSPVIGKVFFLSFFLSFFLVRQNDGSLNSICFVHDGDMSC